MKNNTIKYFKHPDSSTKQIPENFYEIIEMVMSSNVN